MRTLFRSTVLAASATLVLGAAVAQAYPQIASVTPSSGPAGTAVTITGSNFGAGAKGVLFGRLPASSFSVNDNFSVTAVAPPGIASGTVVDIRVQGVGNDASPVTPVDTYTFTDPAPAAAPAPAVAPATPAAPPVVYTCNRVPSLVGHTIGYARKVLALDSCNVTVTTLGTTTGTGIRIKKQSIAPGTPVTGPGPLTLTLAKKAKS